jgi:hypothetical protein
LRAHDCAAVESFDAARIAAGALAALDFVAFAGTFFGFAMASC